jgi:hypothetical protein
MDPMTFRLRSLLLALILCLMAVSTVGAAVRGLKVERAKTRIGIARVVLNIDHLTLTDQGLSGDYAIRIPLAPFMDDSGTIRIPVVDKLKDAVTPGNTLRGTASSNEDGRTHEVACTFTDNQKVRIVVTTPDRVLSFEAPYSLSN